ncbi:MAG TPA: TetR/AcrR family transcriptional regulator C-terminal ligand-binding domain-containing protein [Candidatus Limnocylindrales bacterium]|nr:TetR/AcrR family transcriptional regulator C-terminal ligand-binding domain-containing protein [Candidatus Limnocylindrales bacterium]
MSTSHRRRAALDADPGDPDPALADPGAAADHRTLPRRRGRALEQAILEAALAELAESGYARLTVERVAERAKAGKASVYRRWPGRIELVLDAVYHAAPDLAEPPDTGTLRGDLLALLRGAARSLAGPVGEALRGLMSEVAGDASLMARMRDHSQGASRRAMLEIARRAASRGEIARAELPPRRFEVGQAMLRQQFLLHGLPIPDRAVVEIVDDVLLPLFHA